MAGFAGVFAAEVKLPAKGNRYDPPDLRLGAASAAVDRGEALPNVSDGFRGAAPDIGASELGAELPHYGIRPEGKEAEIDGRIGAGAAKKAPEVGRSGAPEKAGGAKPSAGGDEAKVDPKAAQLFRAARQAERSGMKALAGTLYERLVKEFPGSPLAEEAKKKLGED